METKIVPIELDALPHQAAFWMDESEGGRIALVGGLGTGKTRALVIKRLLMQFKNPGCDSMLVEPTYRMIQDILVPAFELIVGQEFGIPYRENKTDNDIVWPKSMGGGITHLRSAEDPQRLAGANLSDVGFDEPGQMQYEAYRRGSLRARDPRAGIRQVYLTGTPEGMGWFAEEFNDPAPPNRIIRARTWHASIASYPLEIARTYKGSEWQREAYLEGKFVPAFTGRCYSPFDRAKHVSANGHLGYNAALELVLACDFNIDAMRWEICQRHPGQFQVLDEIALGQNGPVAQAAEEFRRRYAKGGSEVWHRGTVRITGDASGKARSQTGDICYKVLTEALRPHFREVILDVPPDNPSQRDRVDTVNYHLSGAGLTVLIHPRCKELTADLEQNAWNPGTADIRKVKDGPEALRTHAADAFGYALWRLAPIRRPSVPVAVQTGSKEQFIAAHPILGARW